MARLSAAVAVLTVRNGPRVLGMTVSAVTSLSLDPPMILVCVDRAAALHDPLVSADRFGINVLAAHQRDVAERFAHPDRHHWDDADAPVSPAGLPLVAGALAQVDCRRAEVFPGGDHSIVTGVVEWARTSDDAPLCYFRSTYAGLAT